MNHPYLEHRDGGYYFRGSRVGLDNVVYLWLDGRSPQSIQDCYPSLSLDQVEAAIAFYLENQAAVDRWLEECDREEQASPYALSKTAPAFFRRLELARNDLSRR